MHSKSSLAECTRVIIVRHGQSTFNAAGRYQGRSDEPTLTAIGRSCAYQTGVALQGVKLDAIYSSPLGRAVETAQEIVRGMHHINACLPKIQLEADLIEIDLPNWQGKSLKFVREHFAVDYRCWQQRPHEFYIEHPNAAFAYPVLDLFAQAKCFWQTILPRHVGETVLVVTHSGTSRALISTALGLSAAKYHVLQQSNCGISILNFGGGCTEIARLDDNCVASRSAKLVALNLTTHLGEVLPKLKAGKQGLRLLLLPGEAIAATQLHRLAEFLQPVTINFYLNLAGDWASPRRSHRTDATGASILQYHPQTAQLQASTQDFPYVWQQKIAALVQADTLITGLIVASDHIIQQILMQLLGINSNDCWRLPLISGTLSIIHYPTVDIVPVTQSINFTNPVSLHLLK